MSNNKVISHDIYAEITNGLFFVEKVISEVSTDDPEEFTSRPDRFYNMSQQELINYFDAISQEE